MLSKTLKCRSTQEMMHHAERMMHIVSIVVWTTRQGFDKPRIAEAAAATIGASKQETANALSFLFLNNMEN